jgi:hypothetical protein
MTVPFSSQGEAAVCARVSIALLKRKIKRVRRGKTSAPILIGMVTADLAGLEFRTIRSCLLSLNAWCLETRSSSSWLTGVLYRDMMGYSLRRCLHDAYKANRRDPRVTNRGVTASALALQSGETPRTPVLKQRDLRELVEDFDKTDHGSD